MNDSNHPFVSEGDLLLHDELSETLLFLRAIVVIIGDRTIHDSKQTGLRTAFRQGWPTLLRAMSVLQTFASNSSRTWLTVMERHEVLDILGLIIYSVVRERSFLPLISDHLQLYSFAVDIWLQDDPENPYGCSTRLAVYRLINHAYEGSLDGWMEAVSQKPHQVAQRALSSLRLDLQDKPLDMQKIRTRCLFLGFFIHIPSTRQSLFHCGWMPLLTKTLQMLASNDSDDTLSKENLVWCCQTANLTFRCEDGLKNAISALNSGFLAAFVACIPRLCRFKSSYDVIDSVLFHSLPRFFNFGAFVEALMSAMETMDIEEVKKRLSCKPHTMVWDRFVTLALQWMVYKRICDHSLSRPGYILKHCHAVR